MLTPPFMIFPAKIRQRFSIGALPNFSEMASLNWNKKHDNIFISWIDQHKGLISRLMNTYIRVQICLQTDPCGVHNVTTMMINGWKMKQPKIASHLRAERWNKPTFRHLWTSISVPETYRIGFANVFEIIQNPLWFNLSKRLVTTPRYKKWALLFNRFQVI